ncbi:clathrin coat assembly protein AP180-like protein [Salvia divinorum]|uniref:Clathrin coat assembly protein AP180-like protein n=1 Tax=Salvia divinorum TaxID=28513 RepID=A0ABD1HZX7_SALDI
MPSKLKKALAAVKDQTSISLAKVSSKDSANLEVAVLKATSHEDVPADDKYAYEVLRLVSSNKIHAAACVRVISKRIGRTRNWVVTLKSLMLVLRIFQDGDPYFPREVLHAMKHGAKILNLSSFRDDSNSSPWDFTSFVRTFALYLDERLECFLTGKLQRRQALDGASETSSVFQRSRSKIISATEPVRDMKPAMLLDKMSYWQRLLDRAMATRPTGCAKENRLVHMALYAVLKESFDLYKDISEGLSLILDSFFHLQYQNCVLAFQTCIKAVKQFEEVSSFFSLCKSLGIGRLSEYPSIQGISDELIESLQEFLKDKSSFTNKPVVANQMAAPAPPAPAPLRTRSARGESYGAQSDFSVTTDGFSDEGSEAGSHAASASLDDLVRGAGTWKSRGISIDLEAYSAFKPDDAFGVSDTGSSRSLPVMSSGADMMSVDDWSTEDEDEDEDRNQARRRREKLETLLSKNWETVLAESARSTPAAMTPMPLIDINSSNFCAFSETSPLASRSEQDLVLFEAAQSESQTPVSQHYNPFLEDMAELAGAAATPTFSAENPNVGSVEDDPFASWADFPGDQGAGGGGDQQDLKEQQELWLQNQNKILQKNWS